jgi:hypothetical protein
MPLQKIQFKPGVNREGTSLSNEGGWFDGDKIRFRSGYPEKIGGWSVLTYTKFLGVCRSLWNWITLSQYNVLGVGTNLKFYVENGGTYNDITPIRLSTTNSTTFAAGFTTLTTNITATDTTIPVTSATNFPISGGLLIIGTEQIYFSSKSGNILTNCIRGFNNTVAAAHTTGDAVNSAMVVVTDSTASNIQADDFVTFAQAVSLGGNITAAVLNQEYQIVYALTGNTYVIQARAAVNGNIATTNGGVPVFANTGDVGNGGSVADSAYQISTGFSTYTLGTGWGAGPWNAGSATDPWAHGWGTGFTTGIGLQLRLWNQVNFGETLLFSPRKGALYKWDPGSGSTPAFGTRGTIVSGTDIPSQISFFTVSDATRIVIAFGCTSASYDIPANTFDALLVRWTAQESYTNWTATTLNQAGGYRLSHGSEIISALQTRQEILIWTDSALYSMQYLGPPYIWGFTLLADNISLLSQNAMTTAAGVTYWMGVDKFYSYAGRVETLPCTVRQYVFNNINKDQQAQFFCGTNEGYSEVWWHYCSANSSQVDRYVIFNYLDRVWYYGTMDRTAWLDSPLRQFPQAATLNNLIVFHEAAVDDGTTNPPTPLNAYIQSSDFDIEDGHDYGFVWRMLPDITFDGSTTPVPLYPTVSMTVLPKQNPGSAYGYGASPSVKAAKSYALQHTYTVQQFTEIIYTRVRGREISFKVASNTLGTQWQLGTPRIDIRKDGRR